MQLAVVGLNHNTATIEIRESMAVSDEQLEDRYRNIFNNDRIYEAMILSTCNRVEYYIVTDDFLCDVQTVLEIVSEESGISYEDLKKYTYIYCGEEAITHLFKVASGLDSLVLGEPQIFGQVKDSFNKAKEYGQTNNYLKKLEEATIKIAKKVRTHTGIGENPVSVSYAAVELASKIFGNFKKNKALIIGAGEMCELAAKHLSTTNIEKIFVTNRTLEKSEKLAHEINGEAIEFDKFIDILDQIDIVISSTGAPDYIVTYEQIKNIMQNRKYKPMFFIDIAVPRDIEPKVNDIENIYVYDIDDLKSVIEANKKEREKEAQKALEMIEDATDSFLKWMESLKIVPVIKSMRKSFEEIKEFELERFCKKMNINGEDKEQMDKLLISYMNKLLHTPVTNLKNLDSHKSKHSLPEAIKILFDLKE
jgi:glutamyl-tRNA reductase